MYRKNISVLLLIVILSVFAATAAFTQSAAGTDIFAAEGPITQADIDAMVAVWPKMMSSSNVVPPKVLFEQHGISDLRGAYLTTKIGNAYIINTYPERAENLMSQMPAVLIPNAEEIKLVGYNMPSLEDIYNPGRD